MRTTTALRGLAAIAAAACVGCVARPTMKPYVLVAQTDAFVVQASVDTAGPYGEGWYLTIAPDGTAFLQVYYSPDPSGSLSGSFHLSESAVAEIQQAVSSQRFFELPSEISAAEVVLHNPDLRISVSASGKTHSVNLYNPVEVGATPEAVRFLAVWEALFRHLHLQPTGDWSPNNSFKRTRQKRRAAELRSVRRPSTSGGKLAS